MVSMFLLGIYYLIEVIFDTYTVILIVRFMLAWGSADSSHPFVQFIIKLTSPVIRPLKAYIHDYRNVEVATLLVIFLLQCFKWLLISVITPGFGFPNLIGILIIGFAGAISLWITTIIIALVILFVISFVQPGSTSYHELMRFCRPILAPIQKLVPVVSGVDISPAIACILLQFIKIVFVNSLMGWGQGIAFIGFK